MTDTSTIEQPDPADSLAALEVLIRDLGYAGALDRLVEDEGEIHRLMAEAMKADPNAFALDWEFIGQSDVNAPVEIGGSEDEMESARRFVAAVRYHLVAAVRLVEADRPPS
jgi:hypothetical protein